MGQQQRATVQAEPTIGQTQVLQSSRQGAVMQTQVLQTGLQVGASTAQYAIGARVEYFSEARGGWLPGVVQGFNAQTGAYVLDVHPAALPSKIRPAGVAGSATVSVQGGGASVQAKSMTIVQAAPVVGSLMGTVVQTGPAVQSVSAFDMIDRN